MKKLKQHKSIKLKRDFQTGGFLGGQGATLGQAGGSIVDMIDPQDEYGARSTGGAIASGALKGAGMGAALGPIGAGVGAVVGGAIGFFKNKKAKEEAEKAKAGQLDLEAAVARQKSATIMANYATQGTGIKEFQSGGKLAGKGIPTAGGYLQAISQDAVEVQGNDPGATDDVQIGDAFVDHNEVITATPEGDGLRIFSDTLKYPGTKKTFSKLAKGLEKQKTAQEDRFPEQNNLVEKKLNALFNVQQMMNGNNQGETLGEASVPAGETPGSGFSQAGDGNMFQVGGELTAGLKSNPDLSINPPPVFNTEAEHNAFYKQQLLERAKTERPSIYGAYMGAPIQITKGTPTEVSAGKGEYLGSKETLGETTGNLDVVIAAMGGLPKYTPAPKPVKPAGTGSDITKIGFKVNKPSGYRYKQGKPAKGSITRQRKSGFQVGGEIKPLSLADWRGGKTSNRDWSKNLLTVQEINGWTKEVQARKAEYDKKLYPANPIPNMDSIMDNAVKNKKLQALLKLGTPLPKFQGGGQFNWEQAGNTASAIIPGLVNMATANKLPKPGKPIMDTAIQLQKVDYGDVQNQYNRNLALQLQAADQGSLNPNVSPALKALAFGQRGENLNRMFGETSRINAQISNQQAQINQQVQSGNNMKVQAYGDSMAARRANQLGLRSQATANIFGNLNTMQRERNQMALDNRVVDMQEGFYKTVMPGYFDRHKEQSINNIMEGKPTEDYKNEPSWGRGSNLYNKKGGKISLKNYRLGGSLKKIKC